MMRKGFRAPSGRANRSAAAALLDKKGITPHMWEVLALVYQARLSRDRGHRAPGMDQTLTALWKRGLVKGADLAGYDGWLWTLTDTGVEMLKAGPDA